MADLETINGTGTGVAAGDTEGSEDFMEDILDKAKQNSLKRFERKMELADDAATMSMYNQEGKGMVV